MYKMLLLCVIRVFFIPVAIYRQYLVITTIHSYNVRLGHPVVIEPSYHEVSVDLKQRVAAVLIQ